jgi:hypothetical protein
MGDGAAPAALWRDGKTSESRIGDAKSRKTDLEGR